MLQLFTFVWSSGLLRSVVSILFAWPSRFVSVHLKIKTQNRIASVLFVISFLKKIMLCCTIQPIYQLSYKRHKWEIFKNTINLSKGSNVWMIPATMPEALDAGAEVASSSAQVGIITKKATVILNKKCDWRKQQ